MRFKLRARNVRTGKTRWISVTSVDATAARTDSLELLEQGESVDHDSLKVIAEAGTTSQILSHDEITDFCMDLGDYMAAGQTFGEALQSIHGSDHSKRVQSMIERMIKRSGAGVSAGRNFHDEEPYLGHIAVALVAQGDATKRVPEALAMLVRIMDQEAKRRNTLVQNLAMPAISACLLALLMIGSGLFIIPIFREQVDPTAKLNALTRFFFAYSDFMKTYWPFWAPVLVAYTAMMIWKVPFRWAQWRLLEGQFKDARIAKSNALMGDFFLLMGALLGQDVPLAPSIKIAALRFKGSPVGEQLAEVAKAVSQGADIDVSLRHHTMLPPKAATVLAIAVKKRKPAEYLFDQAERAYIRSDRAFASFARWITVVALLTIGLGCVLMFLGLYAPVLEMLRSTH